MMALMNNSQIAKQPEWSPRYRSYLLRLWFTGLAGCWQASLDDSRTGERTGFATLEELFSYLMEQATEDADDKIPGREESR